MGDTTEREYSEKISKIKLNSSKKVTEVLDVFSKVQKYKAESFKKTEEMMTDASNDFEKLERDMAENKDLSPESQNRLSEEIAAARTQIRHKYDELKTRISDRFE